MHLGYYIHILDSGSAQKARLISQNINLPITFIGNGVSKFDWGGVSNYQLLDLPTKNLEQIADLPINQNCQTYSFHHAPYYDNAERQKMSAIAKWVEQTNPTAVIVDDSAEIIQYLRLLAVPVIAIRQDGDRSDFPHLCGYNAAYKLLALFPQILEPPVTPNWMIDNTIYVAGFSRYSSKTLTKGEARAKLEICSKQKVVLVLNGSEKAQHLLSQIALAASASPEWLWLVVGKIRRDCGSLPENIAVLGWREDIYTYVKAADVAIASGGHNIMMEIGTAKTPFMCIPDDKPFEEQRAEAKLLEELGLCFVTDVFPDGNSVKFLLGKLQTMDVSRWQEIISTDGAVQAGHKIESEVKLLDRYLMSLDRPNEFNSAKLLEV